MNSKDAATHAAQALLLASKHPHPEKPETAPPVPFTIAFSREAGSGGKLVARELGKRLNWPVYDHELIEHLANELQVDVHQLKTIDERPGNFLIECLSAFAAAATVSEVTYFRRLLKLLLALGERGECVIVGRGAPFVLPYESTLRVRLVASTEDRIALISREHSLNHTDAAQYVEKTDRQRIRFIKDHFRKDPTDPLHYDLVLNSSRFSVTECVELILDALKTLQTRKAVPRHG